MILCDSVSSVHCSTTLSSKCHIPVYRSVGQFSDLLHFVIAHNGTEQWMIEFFFNNIIARFCKMFLKPIQTPNDCDYFRKQKLI